MKSIVALFALLSLSFSASAYTNHFVPKTGAIWADIEGGFITGSYTSNSNNEKMDLNVMGATARGGYGITDSFGIYADVTYLNRRIDQSSGILSIQNDSIGVRDFRVGVRGATDGSTFQFLYNGLLSVPADSVYKENRDTNPTTTSASEGRIAVIPQAGLQVVLPTMKFGLLASYTFYPTYGKAEITSLGTVFTGDRTGGEVSTLDLFVEGGITETLLMGGVISYNDQAKGNMKLQPSFGGPSQDLSSDPPAYWVYQIYGSFKVSDNTRLIPAFGYWSYATKEMKNQQFLGGSLALRMVF